MMVQQWIHLHKRKEKEYMNTFQTYYSKLNRYIYFKIIYNNMSNCRDKNEVSPSDVETKVPQGAKQQVTRLGIGTEPRLTVTNVTTNSILYLSLDLDMT